jgi:hypothetical protein
MGLGPSSSTGATIGASGYFGSRVAITSGNVLTYPAVYSSAYTVFVLRNASATAGAGNWSAYAVRHDGSSTAKWLNGVRADGTSTTWLTMSGGSLSLSGDGATRWYDELVVLPFAVPDAWPPSVYGLLALARPFSALPKLSLAGTAILEGGARTVIGATQEAGFLQAGSGMLSVSAVFSEG